MHGFREESGGLNWLIYVDMEKTGMSINVILFLQIRSMIDTQISNFCFIDASVPRMCLETPPEM